MKIIATAGTFDYLHKGHRELLDAMRHMSQGISSVIVYVNSDSMITTRKPDLRLGNDEQKRIHAIKEAYPEFEVELVHNLEQLRENYMIFRPLLCHGTDWNENTLSNLYSVEKQWWPNHEITLCFIHRSTGESSTRIREQDI